MENLITNPETQSLISRVAYKFHKKVNFKLQGLLDFEDYKQELVIFILSTFNDFSSKDYKNKQAYLFTSLYCRLQYIADTFIIENSIRVNYPYDEMTVEAQEITKMDRLGGEFCLIEEVEYYCTKFNIYFDIDHPLTSLLTVLKLVFNSYTAEEFNEIAKIEQDRLFYFKQVIGNYNIELSSSSKRIIYSGVIKEVRDLFKSGVRTFDEISASLKKKKLLFNEKVLKRTVSRYRSNARLDSERTNKKSGLTKYVRDAILQNEDTPVKVHKSLLGKGLNYPFSSVCTIFYRVKKEIDKMEFE